MEALKCRARLAVLWLIISLGFCAFIFLMILEPGVLEDLLSGKFLGSELKEGSYGIVYFTLSFGIPCLMAWAAMTLNLTFIRWANTILGILIALPLLIETIIAFNNLTTAIIIVKIFRVICLLLIAWYGFKLPKTES